MNVSQRIRSWTSGDGCRRACNVAFSVLVLVGLTGCDSKSDPAVKGPQASGGPAVQGELIQKPASESVSNVAVKPGPAAGKAPEILAPPPALAAETSSGRTVAPAAASAVVTNGPDAVTPSSAKGSASSVSNAPADVVVKSGSTFAAVGFDKLSAFNFEISDEILQSGTTNAAAVAAKTAELIPKAVRDFDQKRIALKGFMLPLKVEGGKVTEMLIMRDQSMCCYGSVPKINEWVSVRMVGDGVKPIMDQAVTLYGTLHVGEMRENGYLVGIYKIDGEHLDGPAEN